jgi:hypothetical protein
MDAGAGLKWLVGRSPGEVDSHPPFPGDWVEANELGLRDQPLVKGGAVGPLEMQGGWAVAQIVAVERSAPPELEECRDQVLKAMKAARVRQTIADALKRLESATAIRILEGGTDAVGVRIQRFQASRPAGGNQ